jgi:hypothetical protein
MMTAEIFGWWLFLCSVAAVNIAAWSLTAAALERRKRHFLCAVTNNASFQVWLTVGSRNLVPKERLTFASRFLHKQT